MSDWKIHEFECPQCELVIRADRAVKCFRCGSEAEHNKQIAVIDIDEP